MTMTLETRQAIERQIIDRIVTDALAAGYQLSVDDGGEITVSRSTDHAAIMAAVMTTDEDYLRVSKAGEPISGWVRLVYGNDGWDVVCDHTTNLSELLTGASDEADRLEAKHG